MQEFLIKHSGDFWISFALVLLAIQIYTLSQPRLFIIAIATGFIAIFLELELLDHHDISSTMILYLTMSASGILLLTPMIKRFNYKRHMLLKEPIGDYAHIHSEIVTKDHIGEISWHGFAKKAVIDPREDATEFLQGQEVIISDCIESVFYVVSNKSQNLINSSSNENNEN